MPNNQPRPRSSSTSAQPRKDTAQKPRTSSSSSSAGGARTRRNDAVNEARLLIPGGSAAVAAVSALANISGVQSTRSAGVANNNIINNNSEQDNKTKCVIKSKRLTRLAGNVLASFSPDLLRHLDCSDNEISDLAPLAALRNLKHLNVSKNCVADLSALAHLAETIAVLDVSGQKRNALTSLASMFQFPVTPDAAGSAASSENNNSNSSKQLSTGKARKQQQLIAQKSGSTVVFQNLKAIVANDNPALASLGFFSAALALNKQQQDQKQQQQQQQQLKKKKKQKLGGKDGEETVAGAETADDSSSSAAALISPLPVLETLIVSRDQALVKSGQPMDDDDDAGESLWNSLTVVSPTLRKLSASECNIYAIPPLDLPLLGELRLARNHITHFSLAHKFKSLQILDVSSCPLRRAGFFTLARFPFLKQLNVHNTAYIAKLERMKTKEMKKKKKNSGSNVGDADGVNEAIEQLAVFYKSVFEFLKIVDGKKLDDLLRNVDESLLTNDQLKRKKRRILAEMESEFKEDPEESDDDNAENIDEDEDEAAAAVVDGSDQSDDDEEEGDNGVIFGHHSVKKLKESGSRRQRKGKGEDGDDDDALDGEAFIKKVLGSAAAFNNNNKGKNVINAVRRRGAGADEDAAADAKHFLLSAVAKNSKVEQW